MAPVRQQSQSADVSGTNDTVTISDFAVGAGSNRSLVAKVMWRDTDGVDPDVTSVKFDPGGGNELDFQYREQAQLTWGGDSFITVEIWTLDNPPNLTKDITAVVDEAPDATYGRLGLFVEEYTGANNGVGSSTGTGTGDSEEATCDISTDESDSMIVAAVALDNHSSPSISPGSGVTEIDEFDCGVGIHLLYWSAEKPSTGGTDTVNGTWTTANRWAICAIELLAASADERLSEGRIIRSTQVDVRHLQI